MFVNAPCYGVGNLSSYRQMFPNAPGMIDAPVVGWQGLDVRFDIHGITGDFSDRGVRLEAAARTSRTCRSRRSFIA